MCPSPTAWTVRDFLTAYMRDNGRIGTIVSDQGTAFNSAQLARFTTLNSITHEFAPSGDHCGTGTVERTIGTIRARLAAMRLSQGSSFALKPALNLVTRNFILSETAHTVTLSSGKVLRKSRLALGPKPLRRPPPAT